MTVRWWIYWLIWRPCCLLLLGLAFFVAELMARAGLEEIRRRRIIDTLLEIEDRT
jgi:hypothetical protein